MNYIISKMVCPQRKFPRLYNSVVVESQKDAKEYVKDDIEALKKEYTVTKTTTKKIKTENGTDFMVVVDFSDRGFAVFKMNLLLVAHKKTEGKKTRNRVPSLDSVEEAMEDAKYIAETNAYIEEHG